MKTKVKNFFKENYKFLIFLALLYFLLSYKLPYAIYTPGGAIDMSDRIEGENTYESKGSLSMTYVSMVKGSPIFLGLSYIIPNWDIVATDDISYDGDLEKTIDIDKIYMDEAISNAKYVAFSEAGIEYEEKNCLNEVTYVSNDAKTRLETGDNILSVDDISYTTLKAIQNYISSKNVGDKIYIKYLDEDEEKTDEVTLIDINGVPKAGISIANICEYESDFDIEIETKSSESGPSGGLITTLAIYNSITEYDITKGLKIMGTGTMEKDGTAGEIGGVKYKILGAIKNNADVFICPMENYKEARQTAKDNKSDIKVIGVENFRDALEKLNEL